MSKMQRVPRFLVHGVLATALLLEGAVLYLLDDPTVRLYVGLALLLPIAWMFSSTHVAKVFSNLPDQINRRRHAKIRALVDLWLAEVRRLTGMAMDGDRGFRDRKEAVAEMDSIEERMRDLVTEIRRETEVVADEPDPVPPLDEPSAGDE